MLKCKSKKLTKEQRNILGAKGSNNKGLTLLDKKRLKVKIYNRYMIEKNFKKKRLKWTSFEGIDDLVVKTFINKDKELIIVRYMMTDDKKLLKLKKELIKEF